MKYHVNDSCIGCGLCTSTCPEVFSMGDDNKAVAAESVPAGAESSAEDAMNGCPVTAIEKYGCGVSMTAQRKARKSGFSLTGSGRGG